METDEPFNLPIETLTTVEEDTASCETITAFQSAASPPHQEDESQLNGDNDHTETGEPFELFIDKETTEEVMSELCKLNVLNVCCDKHEDSLPYLIMQYVHIRFHTESKRFRNIHLSSDRTQMKTNKKLSRIPKSAENSM
ncbi:hypothetical protein DAPPUDRAFT_327702 [Daphnia pulex]|uniref:Uncharacterized protein n=1 Tax=Daphnia pulex TaxID=6669 RepID=E9HBG3_DAPPU|nr:hypothetical protein DAPPUDRAFT_327702 [Daphnia pulex]|eukprot:EFX70922.1 hypothetical protein DAPPUDRAFT_327702 [Daphnia pulex]